MGCRGESLTLSFCGFPLQKDLAIFFSPLTLFPPMFPVGTQDGNLYLTVSQVRSSAEWLIMLRIIILFSQLKQDNLIITRQSGEVSQPVGINYQLIFGPMGVLYLPETIFLCNYGGAICILLKVCFAKSLQSYCRSSEFVMFQLINLCWLDL